MDGPEAAVAAFHAEANAGNTGYQSAVKALQKDFCGPRQDGPIRAAEFHSGNADNRDQKHRTIRLTNEDTRASFPTEKVICVVEIELPIKEHQPVASGAEVIGDRAIDEEIVHPWHRVVQGFRRSVERPHL